MTERRTLVVHIDGYVIGDGEIALPRVGDILAGPLTFTETPSASTEIVSIRALLESTTKKPFRQYTGPDSPRRWQWNGLLRGDGWTATWHGFRPRTGDIELIGRFLGVYSGDPSGRFRGRVTRVQMIGHRFRRGPEGTIAPEPGFRRTRDVEAAPRFFDHRMLEDHAEHVDGETSVLVDLDLDDVPPIPARPSIEPSDISAAGDLLWTIDDTLPLAVSVDAHQRVNEYLLPGAIGDRRYVRATPSGCWVTGADGTYWLSPGNKPVQVDERPTYTATVNDETLLTSAGDATWRLYRPGSDPIDVPAVDGYVNSVAVVDDYFVAVVGARGQRRQLVRVMLDGQSTSRPIPEPIDRRRRGEPFLAGNPLRLVQGPDIGVVQADLSLRPDGTIWPTGRHFFGGQVGDYAWTIAHPPDGTGPAGWWPLPGPVTYDRTEQFWLLTIYSGRTFLPLTSVPVRTTRPSITIDSRGRIAVTARGGIKTFQADWSVMQWPTELDVTGLLDRAADDRAD